MLEVVGYALLSSETTSSTLLHPPKPPFNPNRHHVVQQIHQQQNPPKPRPEPSPIRNLRLPKRPSLRAAAFHSNEWEPQAAKAMSANSAGYAIGNAGSGETAKKNVDAFKKWSIVPQRLVKSEGLTDLTTRIMGHEFQFPIAAGPVGVLREFFPRLHVG
jgi:hypothetical protein